MGSEVCLMVTTMSMTFLMQKVTILQVDDGSSGLDCYFRDELSVECACLSQREGILRLMMAFSGHIRVNCSAAFASLEKFLFRWRVFAICWVFGWVNCERFQS